MSTRLVLCIVLLCSVSPGPTATQAAEPWKELSKKLDTGTPAERLAAAQALGELGIDAEPAVSALINALTAKEVALQQEAVLALGQIGPAAVEAVPALVELLKSPNQLLRFSAVEALGNIGPAAKAAVPELAKLLKEMNPLGRVLAAAAIASIGQNDADAAKLALPILLAALEDPKADIGTAAIPGITALGSSSVPGLVPLLKKTAPATQIHACSTLGLIGHNSAPALTNLLALLASTDISVRTAAIDAVGKIADPEKPGAALEALISRLEDKEAVVRADAARALGQFGASSAPAVEKLRALLKDKADLVRRSALWALGEIGPAAGPAAGEIDMAWDDPIGSVTVQAAEALSRIGSAGLPRLRARLLDPRFTFLAASVLREQGPAASEAVSDLIKALGTAKTPEVRAEVILALAAIGEKAKAATDSLYKVLADEANESRPVAVYALVMLGEKEKLIATLKQTVKSKDPRLKMVSIWAWVMKGDVATVDLELALPALREGLSLPRPLARREAILAIGRLGERAGALAPDLAKALDDEAPEVRDAALHALSEMGKAAEPAVPRLLKMLTSLPDVPERRGVIYVLGKIGPKAYAAAPALKNLARGKDPMLTALAIWSLVQIEPLEENRTMAVPVMLSVLNHAKPKVREEAARLLGKIGQGNKAVIPALQKLTTDRVPEVETAAKEAIKALSK